MSNDALWSSIERKTKSRLRGAKIRNRSVFKLLTRSSNMLFALFTVTLAATVVHMLYRSPMEISLEEKINIGSVMTDEETPLIAEARQMRLVAMDRADRRESDKEFYRYAVRYDIDWNLARLIYSISESEGVDPDLIFGIIRVESRFNPNAVGSVGEIGLMQIRPETAITIDPGSTVEKLFDPAYNVRLGIRHLKDHLHFFRGDLRLALLAYNRGRGTINNLLMIGENPSNGYATKVLKSEM